jgi:RNA polymerase sigma-70 factor, ECF subfamily
VSSGALDGSESWRRSFDLGRRAWPGVDLSWDRFVTHLRGLALAPMGEIEHGEDLFLAVACLNRDARATRQLEEGVMAGARAAIRRVRANPDFVEEVLQELRTKLLVGENAGLRGYAGRGPLSAWVRVAASRCALDALRSRGEAPVTRDVSEAIVDYDLGPEQRLLIESHRHAFHEALAAALSELSPQDRNLLRRHLVDGMTLEEIAAPYGVHLATIARRLSAIREEIARSVRTRLLGRFGAISTAQLESVLGAIRSQVYVSLSPLLKTDPGSDDHNEPAGVQALEEDRLTGR